MDEHRHIESGETQCVGDGAFVTEVGQRHKYAVNFVAVLAKQIGAAMCFFQRFNCADIGRVFGRDDGVDACLLKLFEDGATST